MMIALKMRLLWHFLGIPDLSLFLMSVPNETFMEKLTVKPSRLKIHAYIGEMSNIIWQYYFFFLETTILFSPIFHDSSFLNSSFLQFETLSLENQKSFLHHFFLQFTRAPLLSGRNNVSFSTGIDYKFLLHVELYWPLVVTCHNYVSYCSCLNSLTVTLYHIF